MLQWRCWLSVVILASLPVLAPAQSKKRLDHIVIFRDGYYLKGKVAEKVGEIIYDAKSGQSFPILSGDFFLDDYVRTIYFGHGQIQKVVPLESNALMSILRFKSISQDREVLSQFAFDSFSPWNDKGERTVHVDNSKGRGGSFDMTQRIGLLTPQYIKAFTVHYRWDLVYSTQEFGPAKTRAILLTIFNEKKEYKEMTGAQKYLELAKFMQEAGWFAEAERELLDTMKSFPKDKKIVEERLNNLKQVRANLLVESIQQASSVGQHEIALDGLTLFEKDDLYKIVGDRQRQGASDLKADYDRATTKLADAKRFLKALAPQAAGSKAWRSASEFIADELSYDTIGLRGGGRLDTFLDFAEQYTAAQKAGRTPTQSAEQVLALAASGWLQGNSAAEPDAKAGLKLLQARKFLLDYLKCESSVKRASLYSEFRRSNDLPVDQIARLIRMIPPIVPLDAKNSGDLLKLPIEAPESNGGDYLVQLPPDYHPQRSYPVLMVFHSGREKADETLKRFTDEAAKHGFILVAPLWAGSNPLKANYSYSYKEHMLVLDTIRDLRRRFQIDSDRVFMFGWEGGANLVYDVGLGHPDLFAGAVVMNGALQPFARRFYWSNAQYLPFYVIDGDRNGNAPKLNRDLFSKDWTRSPFNCMFAEYRGRGSEWYAAEVANSLNWMSRKKRHHPMKELGRGSTSGGLGEEFRSSRALDIHFYWLSSESIADRNSHDHRGVWPQAFKPATFQASLSVGNLLVKGEAKTWYQVNARATGMSQLTLWISPSLMELPNLLTVRVNGQEVWNKKLLEPNLETMLEELYRTGDRQRLYVAKIDFRL